MSFDFSEARKSAEREGQIASDIFKFKEGANRIRLLSECLPHQSTYNGERRFKWLCYVLDRADGQIKPFFMPHTIYKQIEALQQSDDYSFDSVPMPYDITINAAGAGTKDVTYTVMAARNNKELTAEEGKQYGDKKSLKELQQALRAKETERAPEQASGSVHFDPDEIPA